MPDHDVRLAFLELSPIPPLIMEVEIIATLYTEEYLYYNNIINDSIHKSLVSLTYDATTPSIYLKSDNKSILVNC